MLKKRGEKVKKEVSIITTIMYSLFAIGTVITLFIVYRDIKNPFAVKFVIGYAIFAFIFIFYIGLITILKVRKLKWIEIRNRLYKFLIVFTVFFIINIVFTYLLKGQVDVLKQIAVPFGCALGIAFLDLLFK